MGQELQCMTSSVQKISKWSVAKDDRICIFFMCSKMAGNQYGQPITDTSFTIKYDDGMSDGIRFSIQYGQY